ncbi:ATP-dependent zinc metalloprotease FtsH [Clostridium cylindrosporum]|uniref:ATP-dependent zinc metalloprotease FtsH n=1 Tax=Clostridium cylindrosporum DSM 605 TaxID=1121307 RepID=A0A0J8DCQ9_CLOCY|nr:ATP-dependent zinc metalloprotease FtsH [Clostridium cylindrosporum]KMT22039.1 ATP-dependent zinc metalloprotease FtsH 1 [Clostridium cylindrosporum DSM 605]
MKKSLFKSLMAWFFIITALVIAVTLYSNAAPKKEKLVYSTLVTKLDKGEVSKLVVSLEDLQATGQLKNGTKFMVTLGSPTEFQKLMTDYNRTHNEKISVEFIAPTKYPIWLSLLPNLLLIVMMIGFLFFFMQQSQGGGGKGVMNFGKSRAKLATGDKKKVTFNDVAGADEEKVELQEIVDFLKQPKKYIELGARIPKGVLLVGPPGTGKTLLAKAVAGEAGVPFFSISGSDFVEMFVGVGASRVRDLFENAKKNAPCIIFIDEIDAVGRQRGAGLGGGHDEREQTLNQLLVEMDGFGVNEGIIMIAATNRPDILDPALLRPGRFDRQVTVNAPDVKGREEILKVHSRNKPLSSKVDLAVLARRTPGFTGADLENLMNEAALLSVRKNKKKIGMRELEEAITRVIAGPEKKSRVMSEKERKLTAYHEAGHGIVMRLLPNCDPVHEISIIPRGRAGGYTLSLPQEDRNYATKGDLKDQIAGLLGGRVAEKIVLDDISTGASNDIHRATQIARQMVTKYGMSDVLGPIEFGEEHGEVFMGRDFNKSRNYSEEVASAVDAEIKGFVLEGYETAEKLLRENIDTLHRVSEALLEREKLEADEFEAIFNGQTVEDIKKKEAEQAAAKKAEKEAAEARKAEEAKKSIEESDENLTEDNSGEVKNEEDKQVSNLNESDDSNEKNDSQINNNKSEN